MEPMVVKRAGPADLIAYCWYELGYQPQESLIVVALHGNQQRLGMIARIDLPSRHTRRSVLTQLARSAAAPLVTSGATGAMALICSDDALRRPEPAIVPVLLRELSRAGLAVPDVLGVSPSAFRSLLCDEVTCCPPQGHPIDEVTSSATAAAQVLHGRRIAAAEADLIADVAAPGDPAPEPPGDLLGDLLGDVWDDDALDALDHALDDALRDDEEEDDPLEDAYDVDAAERLRWWSWWRETLASEVASGSVTSASACGSVTSAEADPRLRIFWFVLRDVLLRDAILLHAMGAPETECEGVLRMPSGDAAWARWGELVTMIGSLPPSETRIGAATELLAGCARQARPGARAPVLSMLAWLAWFQGNGIRARLLVQQVFDEDPKYSLAQLIEEFLLAAVPPPWIRTHPANHSAGPGARPARKT